MYFTKKERVVIIVVACFIGVLSFFKIFNPDTKDEDIIKDSEKIEYKEDSLQDEDIDKEELERDMEVSIMVHIAGEVNNPGILELKSGDRIIDAIELSGGLTDEADIKSINLARKLNDEEKIYIPREGESIPEDIVENNNDIDGNNSSGMIDINICSKEELMTLPGIGDKTADKILEYRKENLFKSIEDIKNVSGIGDKKYEAIKDMIRVN